MCGEAERWLSTAYPFLHQEYLAATSPPSSSTTTCLICCLRPHSGLHYGLHTCEGDKQFLKRTFHERIIYEQCLQGACLPRPRGWCKYCRLRRCLVSGINLNLVRVGEARVKRGTKRSRDHIPARSNFLATDHTPSQPVFLTTDSAHHQVPQIYPQTQHYSQVFYQPYHTFLRNEANKFWMTPPVNPLSIDCLRYTPLSAKPLSSATPMSLSATPFTPGNPISLSNAPFIPTTPVSFGATPFTPITPTSFSATPIPTSTTPFLTNPPQDYNQWYVGPQLQNIKKENDHWYLEELANFMHFPRNDQHTNNKRERLQSKIESKPQTVKSTQAEEQLLCPKLKFTDAQEELAYGQNNASHEQGEVTYEHGELSYEQEELAYQQSAFERSQEDLTRPVRTSSNKTYMDNSSPHYLVEPMDLSSLSSPIDLSSLSSPIDLSSPSSRPTSVISRPPSIESFGLSRPSSTGSIGLSRPPSTGTSSRPPSQPEVLEMSGNNKFSVNSLVLQDALDKVQGNISVVSFANISNLSSVLEAS